MGATSVTLDGEFTVTNSQGQVVESGPAVEITGTPPPSVWSSVWPWILIGGAVVAVWWIAKDDKGGGASSGAPFAG